MSTEAYHGGIELPPDSKGLALPGGPFVQVGHVQEQTWMSFSDQHDDGTTVGSTTMHYQSRPEQMLEAANTLAELAGAMRDQAVRALDFRAQLREMTF